MLEIDVSFERRSREGVDKFHNITFTIDGSFEIPFTININFIDGTANSMCVHMAYFSTNHAEMCVV